MKRIYLLFIFLFVLFPSVLFGKSNDQLWIIDAGHGGYDVGCEGSKTNEKVITLAIARRVAELVRKNISGVKVQLTRDNDSYLTLARRVEIANSRGASLFLSIHVNAAPDASSVRGTETFYGPVGMTNVPEVEKARKRYIQRSELLAWCMQKQYGLVGRPISRGVKRERYYVILYTEMPSILTEVGFISNASDQAYMMSDAGQEEIAQCIYRGLVDYKDCVDRGREKRTLAQMRQTGGRPTNEEVMAFVGKDKSNKPLEAVSTKVEKLTEKEVAAVPKDNTVTKSENSVVAKNEIPSATKKDNTSITKNEVPYVAKKETQTSTRKEEVIAKVDTSAAKKDDAIVLDASLEPELETGELRFNVQIFALMTKIPVNDPRLKGLKDVQIMEKDGRYKYLCGSTSDYVEARRILEEVRKQFPDAFLVAFLGNRQISTADAQEMYVGNK